MMAQETPVAANMPPAPHDTAQNSSQIQPKIPVSSSRYSHPQESSPSLSLPVPIRNGESKNMQLFLSIWAPLAHCVLSVILAVLLGRLDGRRLNSTVESMGIKRIFRLDLSLGVSDVTTLISLWLLIVRTVAQVWVASMGWRGAMILLGNDGLSLRQLDTMLSFRIPTTFRGRYAWLVAVSLMLIFPATMVGPVLSGSVDWIPTVANHNKTKTATTLGQTAQAELESFKINWNTRKNMVNSALGTLARLWFDKPTKGDEWGLSRIPSQTEFPIDSVVEDIPMPWINIESIEWRHEWEFWAEAIALDHAEVIYTEFAVGGEMGDNFGNAVFYGGTSEFPLEESKNEPIMYGWKYVAVSAAEGDGESEHCKEAVLERWEASGYLRRKSNQKHRQGVGGVS